MLQDVAPTRGSQREYQFDGSRISLANFDELVMRRVHLDLCPSVAVRQRMDAAVQQVATAVENEETVYGVTTGFGAMADAPIACNEVAALQQNLLSFLASGAGSEIAACHVRGAMLLRAHVLLQGMSGARLEIVDRLVHFLNANATPVVRELGSIGASGDLVPLSTIARAICGQSSKVQVRINNAVLSGPEAIQELGLEPLELLAKEGLAMVNGTSFSAAIAANATMASKRLMALSFGSQAMLMRALQVDPRPFASFVHQAKPHPGQIWSAQTLLELLQHQGSDSYRSAGSVQDRYSLRCFPQYTGAIVEGLARIEKTVEIEMNAVSDNPLIDVGEQQFHQSGNFLGQYVSMAMDDLRRDLGLLAKHLDVQIASVVTPEFNGGLSPSLRGNDAQTFNMGLKGLQIAGNSIVPMLIHLSNPLVSHYPTHAEQFNQNINGLSWGAAHLAWKSVQYFQQYMAIALIFSVQALDLRAKQTLGHFDGRGLLGAVAHALYSQTYQLLDAEMGPEKPFLFNDSDRWLERDVEILAGDIATCGALVSAVQPIVDSFDKTFEASV